MVLKMFNQITNWENQFYTIFLILSGTTYGMIFSYFPNITVDMKYILNTSMSMITLYTTIETVGRIVGTLVPLFYKYLNRQLVYSLVFMLITISCSVIPLVPNIWILYVCAFVGGFGASIMSSGGTVWLIEIWQRKSGPILQINEFGFGIGSILATVILKPFLVGEIGKEREPTKSLSDILYNLKNENNTVEIDRRARLMWPSLITGACILPVPIASVIMYFIKPYKTPEIQTKQKDENSNTEDIKLFDRPETPRKTFRWLCAFWYTSYLIFQSVFQWYAVTYFQYCPQKLSAQKAAEIFSISTAVLTAFRGINVFVGLKVKMLHIIGFHYIILIIGMILLVIGQHYLSVLWTASIVMCWGFSTMVAGVFAFTGEQLTLTNTMSTMMVLLRALFTLVTPMIIGLYIEKYSQIFIIVLVFYLSLSIVIFAAILYLVNKYSKLMKIKPSES